MVSDPDELRALAEKATADPESEDWQAANDLAAFIAAANPSTVLIVWGSRLANDTSQEYADEFMADLAAALEGNDR